MAAAKASKSKPERTFMRGPHMSSSELTSEVDEKPQKEITSLEKRKWYDVGFPTSVYFIISNEFCERFTYYGMKAILIIYLMNGLEFNSNDATAIYHAFAMICYFTPIFGGMIADVWWGKYLTIVILSVVYAIGNCITAFTSFPDMVLDLKRIGCFAGLLLIGIGTGGIKPCVSSFGADQIPEEQTEVRSRFFSAFYFSINAGSMLSMIITPILRSEVQCGDGPCFPLAFGVPAGLMIVAIVIFLIGTPLYIKTKPKGNVLVKVFQCIGHAVSNWSKYRHRSPKPALLDYADDKYETQFIEDVRACKRIVVMLLPVPVFWALFDQTGSTWTLQAQKMDGSLGSLYILPDQFQVINPILVMFMIPLFQSVIYPMFNKCKLCYPNRLLQRMTAGGILAASAFVVAALVQNIIEPTAYKEPPNDQGRVSIINADSWCNLSTSYTKSDNIQPGVQVKPVVMLTDTNMTFTWNCSAVIEFYYNVSVNRNSIQTVVGVSEYGFLQIENPKPFEDTSGAMRVVWFYVPETGANHYKNLTIYDKSSGATWDFNQTTNFSSTNEFVNLPIGTHEFRVLAWNEITNKAENVTVEGSITGGIDQSSVLILRYNATAKQFDMKEHVQLEPKTISLFWMVPQYVILTSAEILFSISGLDFAYSQAPASMRSVMMAVWLLTVSFGNLIVLILANFNMFGPPGMSLFYAVLMALDIVVFAIMAYFYVYIDQVPDQKGAENRSESSASSAGTPPPGYPNDGYDDDHRPHYYKKAPDSHYVEESNL